MFRSDLWMILWWCIYGAYMVIFIRTRRSTKLEYTSSSLDDGSLIYCCCHMHKNHTVMMQALLWIRIVAVDDIKKFFQMSLSSRYIVLIHGWLLKVALLETWWWVLIYMMIGWYLHMLIDADVPKILGSCRSWRWCNGYGGFTYNVNDFMMMFKRRSWHLCSDIPCCRTFTGCWYENGCTRVS